jgi:DNA-directed RNA polymerase III subunit RPC7
MTAQEKRQLTYFLNFRQQIHDGPLYTQTRTELADSGRMYGQEQAKKRYGVKSKATVDPFWAVPMYRHRFIEKKRALPDLSGLRAVKEFFPAELHAVLEGAGSANDLRSVKRRKMTQEGTTRSNLGVETGIGEDDSPLDDAEQKQRALEALENVPERRKGGEETKEGEDGKEGDASEDDIVVEEDDEWAVGRYDEDPDPYEDPDADGEELGEEEGEGDYEIQQHYEDGDDDDDGDGGDYEDGGD